jgi:hypothetical protein
MSLKKPQISFLEQILNQSIARIDVRKLSAIFKKAGCEVTNANTPTLTLIFDDSSLCLPNPKAGKSITSNIPPSEEMRIFARKVLNSVCAQP